jgi:hypothetical protein
MREHNRKDRYNESTLSFRLPLDEAEKIINFAESNDASISWAIRQFVRAGMVRKQAA